MKKILFLTLIGFTVLGCSSDDESNFPDSEYSEYIIENAILTDIDFMPEEIYTTNETQEPLLTLKLITSEIFPCINYGISTTEIINGSELIVRFEEIIKPELCFTAIGPTTSYIVGYVAHAFGLKNAFYIFVVAGLLFIPLSQFFFKLQKKIKV